MLRKNIAILTLITSTFLLCILLMPLVGAQRRKPPTPVDPGIAVPGPTVMPSNCCGKKPPLKNIPNYSSTYASFTGQVAVVTNFVATAADPSVRIWDLKNQGSALPGVQWSPNSYSNVDWTRSNIGDVFGLTLDSNGNIYVASTRVYGTNHLGSLAGTPGHADIYKLNGNTGAATRFVQTDVPSHTYVSGNKIPNTGPGLGNIHYSCAYDKFYVSNFEDGKIYRIDSGGNILSLWDHGQNLPTANPIRPAIIDTDNVGTNPGAPFTQLGRRIWAVNVYNGRLFYSTWARDIARTSNAVANEIWSVAVDGTGNFTGSAKLEIVVPPLTSGGNFSSPVSDISFTPAGRMLLAERMMQGDTSVYAHSSRVLEYQPGIAWTLPNATKYQIGWYPSSSLIKTNSSGGVDLDNGPLGRVWATGDFLTSSAVYGLQGLPASGGDYTTSLLIDFDGALGTQNKTQNGDVDIPCYECFPPKAPVIKPPDSTCAKPGEYCVTPAPGISYTWNVTGGTPATGTGSCIVIAWGSTSPKVVTVTATSADGCKSTTTLELPDCTPPVDPCCPPWNKTVMSDMMFTDWSGSINAPYTLHFVPTALFNSQMQAYINYLHLMNPAITAITIDWRLHDQGAGTIPTPPYGPQIGPTVYTTWTQGGSGNPSFSNPGFFNLPTAYPMVKGEWYMVHTGIYLENGQHFFPDTCANTEIYVKWQVMLGPKQNEPPVLVFSDGKKIIKSIPMTRSRNP